jgi:hypothetical protein
VKPWTIPLRVTLVATAFLAFALPAAPAVAQSSTVRIAIDTPSEGNAVSNGRSVVISGWAADPSGSGTGVDSVRIYLDASMESGGTLLGNANYGDSRPDVATALGSTAVTNSGFQYTWTPSGLNPGPHTLYVYANSNATGWGSKTLTITVQGQAAAPPTAMGTPMPAPTRVVGTYWPGNPGPGGEGLSGPPPPQWGSPPPPPPGPGFPGPGYPGPGFPGPGFPGPGYPGPGPGGPVCIMIYPPPPGC